MEFYQHDKFPGNYLRSVAIVLAMAAMMFTTRVHCASTGHVPDVVQKRQSNEFDSYYFPCEHPSMDIPNGGIKVSATDGSNFLCAEIHISECKPRFYCNHGYRPVGEFDLKCLRNFTTREYRWHGPIPTCIETSLLDSLHYILPVVGGLVLMITSSVCWALRQSTGRRITGTSVPHSAIGVVSIPASCGTPPQNGRARIPSTRLFRSFSGGAYTRFDDTNVAMDPPADVSSIASQDDVKPPSYNEVFKGNREGATTFPVCTPATPNHPPATPNNPPPSYSTSAINAFTEDVEAVEEFDGEDETRQLVANDHLEHRVL